MTKETIRNYLSRNNFYTTYGKIAKIVGTTVEATGLTCNIGDVCRVYSTTGNKELLSEVVGFKDNRVILMPYEDIEGIGYGSTVKNTNAKLMVKVSNGLIGRTVNALCEPIDDLGPVVVRKEIEDVQTDNDNPEVLSGFGEPQTVSSAEFNDLNTFCPDSDGKWYSIQGVSSNPMKRPPIKEPIQIGVKAIDGMLTIGKGQRMGIFAGSGVGKSTLMGMIARNVVADVNVIALVGERGRELLEFINRDLGEDGLKRSVVVVATSDQPAMMRSKCALTATTIAEYFRDQGKDVLLMMDNLTRYCMAQREIGLSAGELPVARGYTPSIYATLPKLLERSGNFEKGSITGIYAVLVEGDDSNEPISDTVRGIIDGHIMLSRKIAMRNHYPSIDVLGSISRLMSEIASPEHKRVAGELRKLMAAYQDSQDLISIGAYKPGSNPVLDTAVRKIESINAFLQQPTTTGVPFEETVNQMNIIADGDKK
ncbi:MAG: FliI/YscN family ATPase [Oscillospiraceae bacterium]|jgi:flagellum-specific ATP synthase|nr:FliI/YscN family ATPase [Oscillospiraceae bacterium]